MRKISGLIAGLLLLVSAISCGGDSTAPGGGGGGGGGNCPVNTFCMINNTFFPNALTVMGGTTVTWRNDDAFAHNVTWDNATGRSAALAGDGTGDTGDFSSGTHTRLFNTPGVYGFHCTIHFGMNGTLTVQ